MRLRDSPYSWANGVTGWVTLHDNELATLKVMMESIQSHDLEEVQAQLTPESKENRFYRLHVNDMGLAYELLYVARLSGWSPNKTKK